MKICKKCNLEFEKTCKPCRKVYRHKHYLKNKEKEKAYKKNYYSKPEKILERREYNKKYSKAYDKKRRAEDPLFKAVVNLRTLIGHSFRKKNWSKTSKTHIMLGCNYKEFIAHLKVSFSQ